MHSRLVLPGGDPAETRCATGGPWGRTEGGVSLGSGRERTRAVSRGEGGASEPLGTRPSRTPMEPPSAVGPWAEHPINGRWTLGPCPPSSMARHPFTAANLSAYSFPLRTRRPGFWPGGKSQDGRVGCTCQTQGALSAIPRQTWTGAPSLPSLQPLSSGQPGLPVPCLCSKARRRKAVSHIGGFYGWPLPGFAARH